MCSDHGANQNLHSLLPSIASLTDNVASVAVHHSVGNIGVEFDGLMSLAEPPRTDGDGAERLFEVQPMDSC
jgi:hypothetical protein